MIAALALMQAAADWPWVGAAEPPAHVLRLGSTEITGRWAGHPVRIRFDQVRVPGCHNANWLHGASPDHQDNCIRLQHLAVITGGTELPISPSRYADLGGLKDVVVRFAPARLTIYMRGPDGPEYYGATLEIERQEIVRRRLDLADGGTEITTYRAVSGSGR